MGGKDNVLSDGVLFCSLICYGSGFTTDLIRIAEKIVLCEIQMTVEFENIGNGSRKI